MVLLLVLLQQSDSLIALLPKVILTIDLFYLFTRPIAELTLVGFALFEIYLALRSRGHKLPRANELAKPLRSLHWHGIFPCLCLSGIGGILWVIGAILSALWLHRLGFLVFATGRLATLVVELWCWTNA